jgi:inosose dehydratase
VADGAGALGAEYLILSGKGVAVNGRLDEAALARKIAALKQIGEYCQGKGVKLAYHHHVDDFVLRGAEVDAILDRTAPGLIGVWLCVIAAHRAGVDVSDYFGRRHQRIAAVHLRDVGDDRQVVLGKGSFNGPSLAQKIQSAGWKGWLMIEEERGRGRTEYPGTPAVQEARQNLKKVFGV